MLTTPFLLKVLFKLLLFLKADLFIHLSCILLSRNCNFLARILFRSQIFTDISQESSCIYMSSLKIPELETVK